ncbi:hypothetical protein AB0903_33605 [Streptomyces sp. NPDC048389]|uniref:hypothetical protein n=1 Tax=Streptomyces sp. NPDC048389 TaxID=3154622 RepID=UPI0034572262
MLTLTGAALAVAAAVYAALVAARRLLYPSPPQPYATFDPSGEDVHLVLMLPCHGPCARRRPHEADGYGTATCVPCGTARPTTEEEQPHAS